LQRGGEKLRDRKVFNGRRRGGADGWGELLELICAGPVKNGIALRSGRNEAGNHDYAEALASALAVADWSRQKEYAGDLWETGAGGLEIKRGLT